LNYVLIDTCILIDYLKGKIELNTNGKVINSIIEMELLQGARDKRELKIIKSFLNSFQRVDINQDILNYSTELIETYSLSHNLQLADATIGATAIIYNIPLLTYNKKDFKFLPYIKLENSY
jgi:predicted nucleic acid-binding protein